MTTILLVTIYLALSYFVYIPYALGNIIDNPRDVKSIAQAALSPLVVAGYIVVALFVVLITSYEEWAALCRKYNKKNEESEK